MRREECTGHTLVQQKPHKVLCISRDFLPGTAPKVGLFCQNGFPDLQAWSPLSVRECVLLLAYVQQTGMQSHCHIKQTCDRAGLPLLRLSSKGMKPLRSWKAMTPADHRSLAG